jgi:tetratricopeptide (TPR) repeat protein
LVVATAGGAYWVVEARRLREATEQVDRDLGAERFSTARQRLLKLVVQRPARGDLWYKLGVCEQARGDLDAAMKAWARVPSGSRYAAKAAAERGSELINVGRYSEAESILDAVLPRAGSDTYEVQRALIRLYRFEGRVADVRALIQAAWARSPDPAAELKELWILNYAPLPVEALGLSLEHADANDERVWLGRANVATLTGGFDEARNWFEACLKQRPDDAAVWRGCLDLALASNDREAAWRAFPHISAIRLAPEEVVSLRAWLAARRGDWASEHKALTELLKLDPGNTSALERLAARAADSGDRKEAERYHRLKADVDRAKDRFRKIFLGDDLKGHAAELSRQAAVLGLHFQARGWALIASGNDVERLRLAASQPAFPLGSKTGPSLADRLADLRPASGGSPPSAHSAPERRAPPRFVDDAAAAGLKFVFDNGQTGLHQLPETMSGGVGVLDYDGDGWLDVYVVQGGSMAAEPGSKHDTDHLFRNKHDGTFEDVTITSGLAAFARGYGLGVAVADYDNDGHSDLFVTRLRSYALYRNRGDGTFEDVTAAAGLAGVRDNPTSVAFADLDGDGDLDLYVCHYMTYDPQHPRLCQNDKGEFFYCDPSKVDPAPDHVFRNDRGRFVDVTAQGGFTDPDGRGLGVVAADLDDDNKVDLYVANDGTANYLFMNRGGFRFEETGLVAGVAGNAEGGFQASMGVACGDLNGDGLPELLVTNFYGEASTLYLNLAGGLFTDGTASSGLGIATRYLLGFGTAFFDFDNDGRLDQISANGHVNDDRPFFPYAMSAQLLAGDGRGRFTDFSPQAGEPFKVLRVGRGLATADLDNDGRVDVLILSQNSPLAYFHNKTDGGHCLTLGLEGTTSNRDSVGAKVTVTSGGRRQIAQRMGGGSYQSACDGRLHFGLGAALRAESVEVRWPSGRIDRFPNLAADAAYRLREGQAKPEPLRGFER